MKNKIFWIGKKGDMLIFGRDEEECKKDTNELILCKHDCSICPLGFIKITGIKMESGETAKFKLVRCKK